MGGGLHIAVSVSTNTVIKSHRCFNSIYMISVADKAAGPRVATLGLTPHSFTHLSALLCLSRLSHTVISLPTRKIFSYFYKSNVCLHFIPPPIKPTINSVNQSINTTLNKDKKVTNSFSAIFKT